MRSIRNLLVANRGEIALRIMRTARAMGIQTVAVYSTADRDAAHVAYADQAVCIGGAAPSASYLDISALLRAAAATGADAVHPGYGFLSENAAFAEACTQAGLVFVGPSPRAIDAMGDKARAKRFMREAGLPCIPGYDGDDQSAATLAAEAERIGYPALVKATAGGGGRGMRVVESARDFGPALESARSEARNAFGDERMLIERVVREPRHIEIQVLVDRYGQGVHFGERDCSVQRRHQKVIEEAPAPGLPAGLRDRLGEAAVSAAVKLGYEGVGTFEFLVEGGERFYFMEMNTRLQVEHPVTEAIAGVDLVAWQLRVAMGEPLGITQADIGFTGHAIEVRLCAEDETRGFMPQSGRIDLFRAPAGIRVEHAVASGMEIPPYYDSMFAKLIAHGRDREEARRKLVKALAETVVFGVKTNRQSLVRFLEHPDFAAGGVDTGFLQRHQAALAVPAAPPLALALAALVLCQAGAANPSRAAPSTLLLRDDAGATHEVRVSGGEHGSFQVVSGEHEHTLALRLREAPQAVFTYAGVDRPLLWQVVEGRVHVQWAGLAASFTDVTHAPAAPAGDAAADGRVRALSNGRVASVLVAPGAVVEAGAPLLTVEAMKMEHMHVAAANGVVRAVLVAVGDSVATGRVLVEMEPAP
ncbi:3-methylcrotonyl-CoA carboxylase [Rhodoferax koreense]|uniref:3-methylcrotonyl-CoA carboxylase n=1 Tax=Rhodoferax koreensis TaxID=1842727 RepID=A0A1P8K163_9BURK|nr:3-methylcrotonyl-CoA carboxylase [Rhodoferax koreense]